MTRLLVFGIALALITAFLHWRFLSVTRASRPVRIVGNVALVVLWLLALVGIGSGELFDPSWARGPAFVGLSWLATVLYLFLGALVVAVVLLAVRLVGAVRRRDSTNVRRRIARVGSGLVAVLAVGATVYGVAEAATPRVTETTVRLDRLPADFDGLRVALVSDLHTGPARGADFVAEVVADVNAQTPDLVVLAGDLTDGRVDLVGADLEPLRDLTAPLGVFAVSGNHEFYADDGGAWMDRWSDLGVTVLRNERVSVSRGDASIDVAGIEDATAPAPYEPDLTAALAGRDPDTFVFLLAHQPLQAIEASEQGVDFQVSGHTHGGQIWPIRYLVPLQQPTVEGLDRVDDTTVYTTRGAGAWGPPVRVAAPPEIAMLTLEAS